MDFRTSALVAMIIIAFSHVVKVWIAWRTRRETLDYLQAMKEAATALERLRYSPPVTPQAPRLPTDEEIEEMIARR